MEKEGRRLAYEYQLELLSFWISFSQNILTRFSVIQISLY
jgi:hypothetical protein